MYEQIEKRWKRYLEEGDDRLDSQLKALAGQLSSIKHKKERLQSDISDLKAKVADLDEQAARLRDKKRRMKGLVDEELVDDDIDNWKSGLKDAGLLQDDVPSCSKPGNPNHTSSDGKFSSYKSRGSQSRHYSCDDDRESKSGKKKSKCGRDRPEKCSDS